MKLTAVMRTRSLTITAACALGALALLTGCSPDPDGPSPSAPLASDPAFSEEHEQARAIAAEAFAAYVTAETDAMVTATDAFVAAYRAGDTELAQGLYVDARTHWWAVEPMLTSEPELVLAIDARESDLLANEAWTGWHAIAKDLWPPADHARTDAERAELADQLLADTREAHALVADAATELDPERIVFVARALLTDVATTAVPGQAEPWSGADLAVAEAKFDAVTVAFTAVRPLVVEADPVLVATVESAIDDATAALAAHGSLEDGFVPHSSLTEEQVRELAHVFDALANAFAHVAPAVSADR